MLRELGIAYSAPHPANIYFCIVNRELLNIINGKIDTGLCENIVAIASYFQHKWKHRPKAVSPHSARLEQAPNERRIKDINL